jgi:4-amino-4-deoxy-L-arabinose transferase-like glycosyltransferase
MGHLSPFETAPADYPNHLAERQPERLRLPSARWLLPLLVLLCLAPRVLMALRIPSICPDGVLYIEIARNLEAGQLQAAFHQMALNVYPVILLLLHRLGFDWEMAAVLWGVVISSLVVLPLWGWVRRQFDDRVALVACLLYAVHPKFIEWSPEAMRDQTFWLLFMLAIYWLWRAVTEVRYGWFLAAGGAIMLASLTRIEGLFLLIPLTLWTFWRWWGLGHVSPLPLGEGTMRLRLPKGEGTMRRKLLFGAMLCVAIFPLALVLVNVLWLCGHSGWTTIRLDVLALAQLWLRSLAGHAAEISSDDSLDRPMTAGRMIWVFIPTMARGLGPVFALLMFGGIWGWRRVWARRDHQALFCTAAIIMCGIWVQLWFDKTICPRYALPIVLMASPFAALGLFGFTARLIRAAQWARSHFRGGEAGSHGNILSAERIGLAPWGVLAILAAVSLADAMTGNAKYFETRRTAADLGRLLRREYPRPFRLVGPIGLAPIVGYYAHSGSCLVLGQDAGDALILGAVSQNNADVVLLRPWKQLTRQRCASLVERMKPAGLQRVRFDLPISPHCEFYVLARTSRLDLVQKPPPGNRKK